ncbi:hypothetical protein MMC31_005070 [Peltigera leucophlebia]|nr:hypothetical protein [Peltigera leucophlebia]
MPGGLDSLMNIPQTRMLKMEPRERLSAHGCLKEVKMDLLSNDTLASRQQETTLLSNDTVGIGGTTPRRKWLFSAMTPLPLEGPRQQRKRLLGLRLLIKKVPLPPWRRPSEAKSRHILLKRNCRERLCKMTLLMIMAVLVIKMRGAFESKSPQTLTTMVVLEVSWREGWRERRTIGGESDHW